MSRFDLSRPIRHDSKRPEHAFRLTAMSAQEIQNVNNSHFKPVRIFLWAALAAMAILVLPATSPAQSNQDAPAYSTLADLLENEQSREK
ncbi:MAG: hypothetical protein ACOCVE_06790, partial [Desulfovermiculus sp.]